MNITIELVANDKLTIEQLNIAIDGLIAEITKQTKEEPMMQLFIDEELQ
jgi:hypothetical protein